MTWDEDFDFYSNGLRLRGVIHWPNPTGTPPPVILQGPGWSGVRCSTASELYHRDLVSAGIAVASFDYRGWGDSEGEREWLRPSEQIEDLRNALTYLLQRPDLDVDRVTLWGLGITGSGYAVHVAAADDRVRGVVLQSAIADVQRWARDRHHDDGDWAALLERIREDALERVLGGEGSFLDRTVDLMGSPPERAAAGECSPGRTMRLGSVEGMLRLRPVDVVDRISPRPLLLISVPADAITPEHHAKDLFDRAGRPKELVRIHGVTHYEQYTVERWRHIGFWRGWMERHGLLNEPAARAEPTDEPASTARQVSLTSIQMA